MTLEMLVNLQASLLLQDYNRALVISIFKIKGKGTACI